MIWSNDKERAAACLALLSAIRLGDEWSADGDVGGHNGPNASLKKILTKRGYSHSEVLMIRFVFDIWNGSGKFNLSEAMDCWDQARWTAVSEFLRAWADPSHMLMAKFIQHYLGGVK